jgi:TPR repeat protein
MLAKMYQFGRGVEANQAEAERWWKEAAECGDTDATKIQEWLHSN